MLKKIGRNDPCWCGSGKKYKDCHLALDEKINSYKLKGWKIPPKKIIKRPDQIDGIRESGLVNIAVLDYVAENIHAGMSTEDIDRLVAEKTKELGGIAAPLNYEGFPHHILRGCNRPAGGSGKLFHIFREIRLLEMNGAVRAEGRQNAAGKVFLL